VENQRKAISPSRMGESPGHFLGGRRQKSLPRHGKYLSAKKTANIKPVTTIAGVVLLCILRPCLRTV